MSLPIVRKCLIPDRLQNTVHTTFGTQFPFLELVVSLSLFFNAEELEMNLFRLFVAAFVSSTRTVSSSSNRNQPDFDTLEAVFLQALSIDWGAFGP
jgi:hypothetical protein